VKDAVSAEERLRALLREVNGTIKDLQGERSKQLDALARGRQEVAALQATVDAIRQEISDIRDNPEVSLALVNSRRKVKSLIEETNAVQGRVSGMRKDLAVLQEEAREISQMSDLAGEAGGFVVIDKRSGKVSIGIKAEPKLQGGNVGHGSGGGAVARPFGNRPGALHARRETGKCITTVRASRSTG
jgi:hypothetical protein